ISFAIALCLIGGIFTEWIGVHAILGAFLLGVAVGSCKDFTIRSKEVLQQFITNIFAPLFFVSIGLRLNFITNFDWRICLIILGIASFGKIIGGYIGARLSGFKKNKAWAMGFGLNTYGSQQIALGSIALQARIIDERIFVSLVIITIFTII